MNKKTILPIIFTIILVLPFVSTYMISTSLDNSNYDIEINVEKGWNLILASPILGTYQSETYYSYDTISLSSTIKKENIKAIYYYDKNKNKYIQMYPDAQEFADYKESLALEEETYVLFSSVWVYSDKAGTLEYSRVDVPTYDQVALEDGWNFLTKSPEMIGKTLEDIKGSCNIEKFYYWDSKNQEWDTNLNSAESGQGIIIKVTEDCALGTSSEEIPVVPNLP